MRYLVRGLRPSHAVVFGGMVLWGVLEFVALNRPKALRQREQPAR